LIRDVSGECEAATKSVDCGQKIRIEWSIRDELVSRDMSHAVSTNGGSEVGVRSRKFREPVNSGAITCRASSIVKRLSRLLRGSLEVTPFTKSGESPSPCGCE
jgi:hypothetical protein